MTVLWIMNWQVLLHKCRADTVCALTRWQHYSVRNATILKHKAYQKSDSVNRCVFS